MDFQYELYPALSLKDNIRTGSPLYYIAYFEQAFVHWTAKYT